MTPPPTTTTRARSGMAVVPGMVMRVTFRSVGRYLLRRPPRRARRRCLSISPAQGGRKLAPAPQNDLCPDRLPAGLPPHPGTEVLGPGRRGDGLPVGAAVEPVAARPGPPWATPTCCGNESTAA